MSENEALLNKIGQLAGQINRHKQQDPDQMRVSSPQHKPAYYSANTQSSRISPYWRARGTPVARGRGRGRGGRIAPIAHHHRTLVINNNNSNKLNAIATVDPANSAAFQSPTGSSNSSNSGTDPHPSGSGGWVAKRDRHMQLINTAVYDQQAQTRAKALEHTRLEKIKMKDEREKSRLNRFLQKSYAGSAPSTATHEIYIEGIKYRVAAGGSKLVKVSGEISESVGRSGNGVGFNQSATILDGLNTASATPKKAVIGGVNFIRSKHGNLWRTGLVKASRHSTKQCRQIKAPCTYFSNSGQCKNGMSCPYAHDPNKVAICQRFLTSNSCPNGDSCDLSHEPTPHRVPACHHFVRGNCSNANCRYAHVRVNPAAPICRSFATLGYCEKGAECTERHVHECPEFDDKGTCDNKKCKLPHIERAGRRRAAAAQAAAAASDNQEKNDDSMEYGISSDEEEEEGESIDSDDVDSDTLSNYDYIYTENQEGQDPEVQHQNDFIHF